MNAKNFLFGAGISLASLVLGIGIGKSYEQIKHIGDYVQIGLVHDLTPRTEGSKQRFSLEVKINEKDIRVPDLGSVLKLSGLNEKITEKDKANKILEEATLKLINNISVGTYGCYSNGEPVKLIEWNAESLYHDWDTGGYGDFGFTYEILFKPKIDDFKLEGSAK